MQRRERQNFLRRAKVAVRPCWYREVFRDVDGRQMDTRPFARKLKALRMSHGWTQAILALECDLTQQSISDLERARQGPLWETLDKLAAGLGVGREDFGVTWEPFP